jgi:acyl-coenzyme A synthetase/AMP-(fatty) acid ligase
MTDFQHDCFQDYCQQVRQAVTNENFDLFGTLKFKKPSHINWVKEIFEGINLKEHPHTDALIWVSGDEEKRYTFAQMADLNNQLLNFARKKGVSQGNILYTQLPLVPANWICYLTAIKGGLVLVPAATTLAVRDIAYRFQRLFPQMVLADTDNAMKIDEAESEFEQRITLKVIVDKPREGWHHIDEILTEATTAEVAETKADDPLFLFFTSGTTGMPKIVTHTHFTYPFGHFSTVSWVGFRHGDIHYNISQPGWAKFAWSSFFAPWAVGATIFANHVTRFDAKEQLSTIEKYGITTFCAPPSALRMFIREDLSAYQLKFRQCVAAGEPLNPEIIDKWKEGTGLLIRDGYGQSETTAMVVNLPGKPVKPGSMGHPTYLYDIVIADEEGNEVPTLEEGIIAVRLHDDQPNGVFVDYLGESERKQQVFKHGLYYTGDKAYKDEEGYIWFVGRDDDVIKASDYRIGPFEVESVLIEHDAVVESAVVGSPHEIRGYSVKAFVILGKEHTPSQELANDIFEYSLTQLARYKMPRIIEFVPELPKTISGKIRRVELRSNEATNKSKGIKGEHEFFYEKY